MRKNIMRTPKEKEKIVIRYLNGESAAELAREIETDKCMIHKWTKKYQTDGLEGLKSRTGKNQ